MIEFKIFTANVHLTFSIYIFHFLFFVIGQKPGNFHAIVHNNDVKNAYEKMRDFIIKELESQNNEGINVVLTRIEQNDE